MMPLDTHNAAEGQILPRPGVILAMWACMALCASAARAEDIFFPLKKQHEHSVTPTRPAFIPLRKRDRRALPADKPVGQPAAQSKPEPNLQPPSREENVRRLLELYSPSTAEYTPAPSLKK